MPTWALVLGRLSVSFVDVHLCFGGLAATTAQVCRRAECEALLAAGAGGVLLERLRQGAARGVADVRELRAASESPWVLPGNPFASGRRCAALRGSVRFGLRCRRRTGTPPRAFRHGWLPGWLTGWLAG